MVDKSVNFAKPLARVIVDSAREHTQQRRIGKGGIKQAIPQNTNIVTVKNGTGADLLRGAVVDIGDYLLNSSKPLDAERMRFEAVEQDDGHYGVMRFATKEDMTGDCHVTGRCIARVNVLDVDHTRASPAAGETYFESGDTGPVEILSLAPGTPATGVQECAVILRSSTAPSVPFMAVAMENIDGYRHAKGTTSSTGFKFHKGAYRPFGIELSDPSDTGVNDGCFDTGAESSEVEAYNIARHQQVIDHPAWLWKDRNGVWLALPMPPKPVQLVLRGSSPSITTSSTSFTDWSIITTGFKEQSYGDLGVAYTGGGNNDVRMKYSACANTGRWDVDFRWKVSVTPGNAITQAPNLFRVFFSSAFLGGSRYTPPVIQRGTTTANSQSILNLDGITRDCVIGLDEGMLVGQIDVQLEGWTSGTTWNFDYELILRPSRPENHALLVNP